MSDNEMTEEQVEESYRDNARLAARATRIDFEVLVAEGFSPEEAVQIVCAWHGRSMFNSGH